MTNDLIQSGTLLIAPPSVQAGVWQKSVILVTEHHERGSLGLMLNKRSNLSIKDFSTQCNIELDIPGHVYIGGPVNQKSFCMLHSNDWSSSPRRCTASSSYSQIPIRAPEARKEHSKLRGRLVMILLLLV